MMQRYPILNFRGFLKISQTFRLRSYHENPQNNSFGAESNANIDVLLNSLANTKLNGQNISIVFDDLYKKYRENPCEKSYILSHSVWHVICDETVKNLSQIPRPNDLVTIFKTLLYFEVPLNAGITKKILSSILSRLCALDLNSLLYLAHITNGIAIDQAKTDSLVTLKRILPMVFQIRYLDSVSNDDCEKLSRILEFISHYPHRFSLKTKNRIFDAILSNDSNLDNRSAINIIVALSRFPYQTMEMKIILKNAMQSLSKQSIGLKDIDVITSVIRKFDHDIGLYGREIFEKMVDISIEGNANVPRLLELLKICNLNKFYSKKLLEHTAKNLNEYSLHFIEILNIIIACNECDYKPPEWNTIILPQINKHNFDIHVPIYPNLNWPLFALTLSKAAHTDEKLIAAILSDSQQKIIHSNDYKELAGFAGNVFNQNLENVLKQIIGEDKVLRNVQNSSGAMAQYLLKVSHHGKRFESFGEILSENYEIFAENIQLDQDEKLVAIVTQFLCKEDRIKMIASDWVIISVDYKKFLGKSQLQMITELSTLLSGKIEEKINRKFQ